MNLVGSYDDIDDYSPVVSDIEDGNEDDSNKSKRMDRSDSFNILDQILNDQSPLKGDNDIEEDNLLESDEPEEIEIGLYN